MYLVVQAAAWDERLNGLERSVRKVAGEVGSRRR
jgi:hypothetical protein